eukprot:TRINITY_DN11343_c0_g1_i1.p1 TRINITY_DN11343_c0_g1~~TRINITY_DN11343_c0_g1_i1.p1  ORF type:complete len:210 (-),score=52.71 TRINITY_DN11343_c0_g1_i1:116-652(-)
MEHSLKDIAWTPSSVVGSLQDCLRRLLSFANTPGVSDDGVGASFSHFSFPFSYFFFTLLRKHMEHSLKDIAWTPSSVVGSLQDCLRRLLSFANTPGVSDDEGRKLAGEFFAEVGKTRDLLTSIFESQQQKSLEELQNSLHRKEKILAELKRVVHEKTGLLEEWKRKLQEEAEGRNDSI